MTTEQIQDRKIGTQVVFTCGRLKGAKGTVVDVRHDGHHVRVRLSAERTVSTRPGAIKEVE
jgi:transcription elongation factor